ncbi:hypothetical protein NPIL_664631 [Nephila pilipes]|uniref:Uncharacterized protein n=1 Tax=Nephila pilipes TaxID=299642 RepID=A0A8X6Q0T9_NEPPI|nr:hypothetical protein NPIL_664631 [Nephila pilipes]
MKQYGKFHGFFQGHVAAYSSGMFEGTDSTKQAVAAGKTRLRSSASSKGRNVQKYTKQPALGSKFWPQWFRTATRWCLPNRISWPLVGWKWNFMVAIFTQCSSFLDYWIRLPAI